jgi:CubicO group peptidase (beta-lactamase class C family)
MKKIKLFSVLLFAILVGVVFVNYEKLNIISGYASKNMASNMFLVGRSQNSIIEEDLDFSPIDLAKTSVEEDPQSVQASVYGFMKRKAVFRSGLGAVLVNESYDASLPYLKPNRNFVKDANSYPYAISSDRDSLLTEVNFNALKKVVDAAFDISESEDAPRQTRAVIVLYKDQLIAEKYAPGFDKETRLLGWSMTKSIQATMLGILVDRNDFDIYASAPIKEWENDSRKTITTHNLLQMNSGLEWEEDYNTISDVTKMLFLDSDMTQAQSAKALAYEPNTHWNYSSGTTNLLSRIIRDQFDSHQAYLDFPYESFIDRIGMNSMILEADLAGNYIGSSYGWATARDWAKFGLLYLNRGVWNGEIIFEESWVDYVTQATPTSDGIYGGQFWLNAGGDYPELPLNMFSCNGYQGQRISIFPDQDLVVVRLGLGDEEVFDFQEFHLGILDAIK